MGAGFDGEWAELARLGAVRIAVGSEQTGERRVALTPHVVRRLVEAGHDVAIEPGAGERAGFGDAAYEAEGATIGAGALSSAELILVVGPPSAERATAYPVGCALLGFLDPARNVDLVRTLVDRSVTAFAVEAIPRTTLAQSMDALSSQATAAGYHAVLLAATTSSRMFPMMITAAGTLPPVKVLVLGAGVAGLQAIATAKRLGAKVSAYDIRPEVREQIESLGARFVAAPVEEEATTDTGYAREVDAEVQRRQHEALTTHVADADVVITTAQVPGRPAPRLVTADMVAAMRPGSVIVDMAAATGGNCELTRADTRVEHGGVIVLGPTDLAGRAAADASEMYARNLAAFVERITGDDGQLAVDLDDEIVGGACITHDGVIHHDGARRAVGVVG